MSTIVYQGTLQSCFESQIIETTTLKLKVPSSIEFGRGPCTIEKNIENLKEKCNLIPNYQHHQITNKPSTTNLDLGGGWSFLQNLSHISKDSNLEKESGTYVHPLSKRSSYSSRLSEKSLQLCTESLGSETGTDIIDNCIFSFSSCSSSSSSSSYSPIEKSPSPSSSSTATNNDHMMTDQAESSPPPPSSSSTWSRNCRVIKSSNKKSCSKFPPPLTTIRGLNSVQFRPHREDGRLIIKAVEVPLTHNYLQAERSNGRLRLCFFKDEFSAAAASNFDLDTTLDENEELEVIEDDMIESDIRDDEEKEEEEIEEKEDDTEEEEEESDMYNLKWDIDGNKFDVEGEMGKEKSQRLSRCKERGQGNKGFCDWRKPLWVATS